MSTTTANGTAKKNNNIRWSKTQRHEGPDRYHFEKNEDSLYDDVKEFEEKINPFELGGYDPDDQLESIVEQIGIRTQITQREIFKIGELLSRAKKICKQQNRGYQKWTEDHFDDSYETLNNYVNVYKYCFGHLKVALQVPKSILYKLSESSFPDELREYLFEKANFDEIDNDNIKKLKKKYEKGGIEAVQDDIGELNRAALIERQINSRIDLTENYLRHLDELRQQFRAGIYSKEKIEFESQLES